MATFKFYVDEKVTTWKRTHFEIEADNRPQAIVKATKFIESDGHVALPWEDVDGVVPEKMSVMENDGNAVTEMYDEDGGLLYTDEDENYIPR